MSKLCSGYINLFIYFLDIDECNGSAMGGCSSVAICQNTIGSYRCVCNKGFVGNGTDCMDLDECQVGGFCDEHASCRNGYGWYSCSCEVGYYGNGTYCAGTRLLVLKINQLFQICFSS